MSKTWNVGTNHLGDTLVATKEGTKILLQFVYESGNRYPVDPLTLTFSEWQQFADWVNEGFLVQPESNQDFVVPTPKPIHEFGVTEIPQYRFDSGHYGYDR